jgi:membrane protease YdiL (CAAX protease family)
VPYHRLHRAGRRGWWRVLVGVLVLAATVMIVVPAVMTVALMAWLFTQGADLSSESERLLSLDDPTPFGLAFLNVVLASAIPAAMLVTWALHGLRPRWLTSVFPRMRWRYFLACIGLSVIALIATVVVSTLVPSEPVDGLDGGLNTFTTETMWFVLVVLFLTPLQSAGEEYAFRGYLTQAFGGLFPSWVAVVGPATLFALAHGSQDLPVFFDRFAFGIVAGILVVRTGGLEAGIAMHVLNNFLAFGLALAFGDLGDSLNPTGGSWWSIPVTLTQSLVYLVLALWLAKRMGLSRFADPAVLAASRGRV